MMDKHLKFTERPNPGKKTLQWVIHSTHGGDQLGTVYFHAPWRKYVAQFNVGVIFDASCLTELTKFLEDNKDARNSEL